MVSRNAWRRQQRRRRTITLTVGTLCLAGLLVAGCTLLRNKQDATPKPGTAGTSASQGLAGANVLALPAEIGGDAHLALQLSQGQPAGFLQQDAKGQWAAVSGNPKMGTATLRLDKLNDGGVVLVKADHLPMHEAATITLSPAQGVFASTGGEPTFQAWTVLNGQLAPTDYYAAIAPRPPEPTSVVVDKGLNALWFFRDGKLTYTTRVATGRYIQAPYPTAQNQADNFFTPLGTFVISNKVVNPAYHHLNIPGGDPRNPLGTRWMGFSVYQGDGAGTWGMHGTNEPEKIGQWVSDGCIRMPTKHAEELFDLVQSGTKLYIIDSVHAKSQAGR